MTGIITKSDIEEVARGWIEGFGWNVIVQPKLFSGKLRAMRWNTVKESMMALYNRRRHAFFLPHENERSQFNLGYTVPVERRNSL